MGQQFSVLQEMTDPLLAGGVQLSDVFQCQARLGARVGVVGSPVGEEELIEMEVSTDGVNFNIASQITAPVGATERDTITMTESTSAGTFVRIRRTNPQLGDQTSAKTVLYQINGPRCLKVG